MHIWRVSAHISAIWFFDTTEDGERAAGDMMPVSKLRFCSLKTACIGRV